MEMLLFFSDESERIYQESGLEAFAKHEQENANNPLPEGPFAKLLRTISVIQGAFSKEEAPIRTALVTARNALHMSEWTDSRAWNVRIDEAFFSEVLKK